MCKEMAPTEAVADRRLRTEAILSECVDASDTQVVTPDQVEASPFDAFGATSMETDTFSATGQQLLEVALGRDVLEAVPEAVSCTLQLAVWTDNSLDHTGADTLVSAFTDPALALQQWTIANRSNSVGITILR